MSAKPELPAPWPAFLSKLDKGLSRPVVFHCLGGFVLTVVYGLPRVTGDLDYVTLVPSDAFGEVERLAGRGSKLAHRYKVCVQRAGGVIDLPDNYDKRLVELDLGLRNLFLKVLEPYDLVLSKLTRNSPKDREDVKFLAAKLKLSFREISERFGAEMKPWVANPERHELTLAIVWQEYFAE
jgi:hypothetical protein